MNRSSILLRNLTLLAWTLAAWAAVHGAALAAEAEGESGGGGVGVQAYVMPYFLLALCIGLALLCVCRSAQMRDKARGEEYEGSASADLEAKGDGVPVVSLGMRTDQVTKLLGKPKIRRRGDDIYRELAQAGKLSEEDAAKEYLVYEHKAGRYELVSLDRRVVEIKKQPKRQES